MCLEYSMIDGTSLAEVVLKELPEKISDSCIQKLRDKLAAVLFSPGLKGVIIKGVESCSFEDISKRDSRADALTDSISEAVVSAGIPALCLVYGSCFGCALRVALSCHFRFASEKAEFGLGNCHVRDRGLKEMLNKITGKRNLPNRIVLSERVTAEEARLSGIVNRVEREGKVPKSAFKFLSALTEKRTAEQIHAIMHLIECADKMERREALFEEGRLFDSILRKTEITHSH